MPFGGTMPLVQQADQPSIDWTGVQPDRSPIDPLDEQSFTLRLRLLSDRARSLTTLREAFAEQRSHGEQLSRHSEPASRPSR